MIKILLIVALAVAFTAPAAFAADDLSAVKASLQKILKDSTPVDGIRATPIEGLYEVQTDYDIIYYYPKGDLFFLGQLHSVDGKDLTAAARDTVIEKTIASLDLTKAVKSGSGKNVVIEFLDTDSPLSRNSAAYWKSRSDVTRYAFLFLPEVNQADATQKSEWILSQKDKSAALDEVLSGTHDQNAFEGVTEEGRNLFKEHLQNTEKAYVGDTPLFFVNNRLVLKPDPEAFDAALNEGEQQAEAK